MLAAFIAAQNLPEGFNSYRETKVSSIHPRIRLAAFLGISLLGPLAACIGYFFLQNQPTLTAGIMVFASGGIVYLLFQDIAPQAKLQRHWTPALGAVFGVAVGGLYHRFGHLRSLMDSLYELLSFEALFHKGYGVLGTRLA